MEKEVVEKFKSITLYDEVVGCEVHPYNAERMWGSNGKSRGLAEEVDVIVNSCRLDEDLYIQCKSVARLSSKFIPTDKIDAVVYKENRGKMYILMELDSFIGKFIK